MEHDVYNKGPEQSRAIHTPRVYDYVYTAMPGDDAAAFEECRCRALFEVWRGDDVDDALERHVTLHVLVYVVREFHVRSGPLLRD